MINATLEAVVIGVLLHERIVIALITYKKQTTLWYLIFYITDFKKSYKDSWLS